ncbi:MAG: hypothetical protein VX874_11810 [Pseudomonadota bacterium]|nr:hypothetical protein [Pseudomonadota bacterium]
METTDQDTAGSWTLAGIGATHAALLDDGALPGATTAPMDACGAQLALAALQARRTLPAELFSHDPTLTLWASLCLPSPADLAHIGENRT